MNNTTTTKGTYELPKQQSTGLQGWVCPKCGGVYSPYQNYCINCTPAKPIQFTCGTGDVTPQMNQMISIVDTGSTKITIE